MLPLVSFLIPAYNHELFVKKCLDSILFDTYENKEIVIIDDGSSDNTANVINDWICSNKEKIRIVYRSRPNRGISATLNELMDLATGEFVRLGSSDDYFVDCGTELLVKYLRAHPEKMAVIGDSFVVNNAGDVVCQSGMVDLHRADKRLYSSEKGIVKAVICNWAIAGPVSLLRVGSTAMAIRNWDESLRIDDWDFFLRIAAAKGLGFIDEQVCAYRVHESNTCRVADTSVRIKNLAESRRVASKNIRLFESPYDKMLMAQCRLIDAKVYYLGKRFFSAAYSFLLYLVLRARYFYSWPRF